ncbi:hypothetical protein [Bacillus sp. T3]|uniref:hypothetical protein n=1 Tax=Bacillus sp. T3 TaxID=467262 RepID=UPI002982A913|nr:hypothetical protein [Bacillus sp. T3]
MSYQEGLDQINTATKMITDANDLIVEAVKDSFLFTWQWWIALAMIVVPWTVWGIVRNRECSARIFSAGLAVMVLSEILDTIGVSFGKWAYPGKGSTSRYNKLLVSTFISTSYRYAAVTI